MRHTWLWLLIIAIGAFLVRVLPYLGNVFTEHGLVFPGADPYYHLRLIDFMVVNFPEPLRYDMYAAFPDGAQVGYMPMLSWLVVGTSWVLTVGHPTLEIAEFVAAWLPAILGALCIIPVYFIGKYAFNSNFTGLLGAFFVAVMPSEFMHRSMLGFCDNHVFEALLVSLVLLCLIMSTKDIKHHLQWAIGAGIALGIFFMSWHGALFFVLVILLWFKVQFSVNKMTGKPVEPLVASVTITFAMTICISVWELVHSLAPIMKVITLFGAMCFPTFVLLCSRLISRNRLRMIGGWLFLIGIPVAAVLSIEKLVYPGFIAMFFEQVRSFFWGYGSTIQEAQPTSLSVAVYTYGALGLFCLGGLFFAFKNKIHPLFLVWSVFIILATVAMRRWGYYSSFSIGLLSAYFIVCFARLLKEELRPRLASLLCAVVLITLLPGFISLSSKPVDMTIDWQKVLVWLRHETEEPFGDRQMYFANEHSQPSYGVLSWWDYGHWIIREGRRIPVSSPTHQDTHYYNFFIAQTTEDANAALGNLKVRYIIIDDRMVGGKFYAIVKKGTGGIDGWQKLLPCSMAYRLYHGEVDDYSLVHQSGAVKVFEKL